jgi:hypothetical protein
MNMCFFPDCGSLVPGGCLGCKALRVLNAKNNNKYGPDRVYIGRPSKWGNPFVLGKYDRETAIRKYKEYILNKPELMAALPELFGKHLVCWCYPLACHGDVLMELVAELQKSRYTNNSSSR